MQFKGKKVNQIKNQNQIKIYIAPCVHEDSEALGGWITHYNTLRVTVDHCSS